MALTHTNRKGHTYYLHEGKTKTGKPKYYVSRKPGENTVEAVPEGYEIYEHPADANVYVRKIRPTKLVESERAAVISGIREATGRNAFFVETEGDAFVVYWTTRDPDAVSRLFGSVFGARPGDAKGMSDWARINSHYEPLMRFTLIDSDKRRFMAERMCLRGGEEFWLPLGLPGPLSDLVDRYAPHLGQESFFELI